MASQLQHCIMDHYCHDRACFSSSNTFAQAAVDTAICNWNYHDNPHLKGYASMRLLLHSYLELRDLLAKIDLEAKGLAWGTTGLIS